MNSHVSSILSMPSNDQPDFAPGNYLYRTTRTKLNNNCNNIKKENLTSNCWQVFRITPSRLKSKYWASPAGAIWTKRMVTKSLERDGFMGTSVMQQIGRAIPQNLSLERERNRKCDRDEKLPNRPARFWRCFSIGGRRKVRRAAVIFRNFGLFSKVSVFR